MELIIIVVSFAMGFWFCRLQLKRSQGGYRVLQFPLISFCVCCLFLFWKSDFINIRCDQARALKSVRVLVGRLPVSPFMVIALGSQALEQGSVFISKMEGLTSLSNMEMPPQNLAEWCFILASTMTGLTPTVILENSEYTRNDLGEKWKNNLRNDREEKQIATEGNQLMLTNIIVECKHQGKDGNIKIKHQGSLELRVEYGFFKQIHCVKN